MGENNQNIYPHKDLTQQLIGYAFDIYKQIGAHLPEKIYQNAFEEKLKESKTNYKRENYCKIIVDNKRVGSFLIDFLIDNTVIVELKVRNELFKKDTAQLLTYMRINHIKIGLLLLFSSNGVRPKRLIL